MSNSIAAITATPQTSPASSAASANGQVMGSQQFLQLLTTELQNQDPLKPMDDTQSVAQLAQFSALQAQNDLSSAFANFQSNFGVMQASSLLGKKVTVITPDGTGNSATQSGTVSSIAVQNGQPFFSMTNSAGKVISDNNGQPLLFATNEIVGIGS
ncbi:MAG: flagellar hook capping FlgD N-terminal domain-containing protein [Candidatus Baltobacteraceae bacterium]